MKRRIAIATGLAALTLLVAAGTAQAAHKPVVTVKQTSTDLQTTTTPNIDAYTNSCYPAGVPWLDEGGQVTLTGHVAHVLKGIRRVKIVEVETVANLSGWDGLPFTYYYTSCGTAKLNKYNNFKRTITPQLDDLCGLIDPSDGLVEFNSASLISVQSYVAVYKARIYCPSGYGTPPGTGLKMTGYRSKAHKLAVCLAGTEAND